MRIRPVAISFVAVAAFGLAACTNAPTASKPTEAGDAVTPVAQTVPQNTDTPSGQGTGDADPGAATSSAPAPDGDQPAGLAQIREAIQLAESEGGGVAYEIDEESSDLAWDIDVLLPDGTGVEVRVNWEGTTVLRVEQEGRPDVLELPDSTLIEAITAAMTHTPGRLDNAELEEEGGQIVWKVELDETANGDDFEIYLDPVTLQVLKTG